MIYTIEMIYEFSSGTMVGHYEVRSYERRTSIGTPVDGKTHVRSDC